MEGCIRNHSCWIGLALLMTGLNGLDCRTSTTGGIQEGDRDSGENGSIEEPGWIQDGFGSEMKDPMDWSEIDLVHLEEINQESSDNPENVPWDVYPPHILYGGDPICWSGGCEGPMQHPLIQIPDRNGQPWGDTYLIGADGQHHLAGFSSGRIALLRRLGLRDDGDWAIMLDPSWEDGSIDFLENGQPIHGSVLVKEWLMRQDHRRFLLIYSTLSIGWIGYAELKNDPLVASRVKVCSLRVPHLEIPEELGPKPILDPANYNQDCD